MKINSPLSANISLTCLGIVIGEIRDVKTILDETTITKVDLLTVAIVAGAFIAFILAGINALRTKSKADDILKGIRERKPIPWQNHESQRSS